MKYKDESKERHPLDYYMVAKKRQKEKEKSLNSQPSQPIVKNTVPKSVSEKPLL